MDTCYMCVQGFDTIEYVLRWSELDNVRKRDEKTLRSPSEGVARSTSPLVRSRTNLYPLGHIQDGNKLRSVKIIASIQHLVAS